METSWHHCSLCHVFSDGPSLKGLGKVWEVIKGFSIMLRLFQIGYLTSGVFPFQNTILSKQKFCCVRQVEQCRYVTLWFIVTLTARVSRKLSNSAVLQSLYTRCKWPVCFPPGSANWIFSTQNPQYCFLFVSIHLPKWVYKVSLITLEAMHFIILN